MVAYIENLDCFYVKEEISAVQTEFCQIAFQPPPTQANGPFGATFFAEN